MLKQIMCAMFVRRSSKWKTECKWQRASENPLRHHWTWSFLGLNKFVFKVNIRYSETWFLMKSPSKNFNAMVFLNKKPTSSSTVIQLAYLTLKRLNDSNLNKIMIIFHNFFIRKISRNVHEVERQNGLNFDAIIVFFLTCLICPIV